MQGVKITPFSELFQLQTGSTEKELFFRSKNDPKFGVKVTPKTKPNQKGRPYRKALDPDDLTQT